MNAVEFNTELSGGATIHIPSEAVSQLPRSGMARVIVLTSEHADDSDWRMAGYQQFLRDDAPEEAIYDSYR